MDTMTTRLPVATFEACYDKASDVLYLNDGNPRDSLTKTDHEEFIWRIDRKTKKPIGVTIIDFDYGWRHHRFDLRKKLRVGLRISARDAKLMSDKIYQEFIQTGAANTPSTVD